MQLQDFLVLATTNNVELMLELRAARQPNTVLALDSRLHPSIIRLIRSGERRRSAIIQQSIRAGVASNYTLSLLNELQLV